MKIGDLKNEIRKELPLLRGSEAMTEKGITNLVSVIIQHRKDSFTKGQDYALGNSLDEMEKDRVRLVTKHTGIIAEAIINDAIDDAMLEDAIANIAYDCIRLGLIHGANMELVKRGLLVQSIFGGFASPIQSK